MTGEEAARRRAAAADRQAAERDRIRAAIDADPDRQRILVGYRHALVLERISRREYDRLVEAQLREWESGS